MPPRNKAARQSAPPKAARVATVSPAASPAEPAVAARSTPSLSSLPSRALRDPIGTVQLILSDRGLFWPFALLLTAFNLVLGVAIIWKVPCKSV